MGFFSRLFGLEKNNKQDQIQRRKQSTKSKSKTYPLNEVGVIGKFSDDAYDKKNSSVVHDLNGKRIFKIPVTARTRAFENENYLGRKTFKSGTVRWVDIDKDEVNKALEEKGFLEKHIPLKQEKIKIEKKKKVSIKKKAISKATYDGNEVLLFSYSLVNESSPIYQMKGTRVIESSKTDLKTMYKSGWRISDLDKTGKSAQFDSFNFVIRMQKIA
jgi:hypothetical protein